MGSSIQGFAFTELVDGSGRGSIRQDGTAQRTFKINWTDLPAFVGALIGGWQLITPDTVRYITPDQHPDWAAFYCMSADYEALGVPSFDGTKSSWEFAKVTATYSPLRFDPSTGTGSDLVTEELDFDCDTETVPGGSLSYTGTEADATPQTVSQDTKIIIPCVSYTITLLSVPTLPGGNIQTILSTLGTLNKDEFKGAEAKKMMFMGARASRSAASIPTLKSANWKIELKFRYRAIPWNNHFVASVGKFVPVVSSVTGEPLYDENGDFTKLLPKT